MYVKLILSLPLIKSEYDCGKKVTGFIVEKACVPVPALPRQTVLNFTNSKIGTILTAEISRVRKPWLWNWLNHKEVHYSHHKKSWGRAASKLGFFVIPSVLFPMLALLPSRSEQYVCSISRHHIQTSQYPRQKRDHFS